MLQRVGHTQVRIIEITQDTPVLFLADQQEQHDARLLLFEQVIIIVHAGVHTTIVDNVQYRLPTVRAITYYLHENSHVRIIQQRRGNLYTVIDQITIVAHGAAQARYMFNLDGALRARIFLNLQIMGSHATVDARIRALLSGASRVSITTRQEHMQSDGVSDVCIRGILYQTAHMNYHGTIDIARAAQRTQAKQQHKVILASVAARASAQPSLQVLANNVRCTHGAAVSRFDTQQLFFLAARGYAQHVAEKVLKDAFFSDMVVQTFNLLEK